MGNSLHCVDTFFLQIRLSSFLRLQRKVCLFFSFSHITFSNSTLISGDGAGDQRWTALALRPDGLQRQRGEGESAQFIGSAHRIPRAQLTKAGAEEAAHADVEKEAAEESKKEREAREPKVHISSVEKEKDERDKRKSEASESRLKGKGEKSDRLGRAMSSKKLKTIEEKKKAVGITKDEVTSPPSLSTNTPLLSGGKGLDEKMAKGEADTSSRQFTRTTSHDISSFRPLSSSQDIKADILMDEGSASARNKSLDSRVSSRDGESARGTVPPSVHFHFTLLFFPF